MRSPLLIVMLALAASGCSCAGSGSRGDGALDDASYTDVGTVDVAYSDTGPCTPIIDSPPTPTCDSFGRRDCQDWSERRAPGLDAIASCFRAGDPCVRGDSCDVVDGGTGPAIVCHCGEGLACEPGFVCARPLGEPTAARTCICGSGPP